MEIAHRESSPLKRSSSQNTDTRLQRLHTLVSSIRTDFESLNCRTKLILSLPAKELALHFSVPPTAARSAEPSERKPLFTPYWMMEILTIMEAS